MLNVCNARLFVNLFYNRQVTPPIVIINYNYIRINKVVTSKAKHLSLPLLYSRGCSLVNYCNCLVHYSSITLHQI